VGSGDGSYTVAKKLADAGVVSSAQSYDEYLCSNGYDKKLRTGTFTIPANATEEQIAKIVTGPGD
jgi:cell division protein YceG involved in septum cleavage